MEKLKVPQGLYKQFLCGRYCDLQIQVENSFFRAHSCVVAAASWVLEAILESSTSEDVSLSKLSIQLHGVSAYAISCLLGFIYTGQFPDDILENDGKTQEVLHAAKLYKMDQITEDLQDKMKKTGDDDVTSNVPVIENGNMSENILENLVEADHDTGLNEEETVELQEILIDDQILQDNTSEVKLSQDDVKKYVSDNTTYAKEHGILYCVLCSEIFKSQADLLSHMNDHKVKYRKQPERAAAATASFIVEQDDDFEDDIDFSIGGSSGKGKSSHKSFACAECGSLFSGKSYLIKHYIAQHPGTIFCKYCVQRFDTVEKLETHVLTHKTQETTTIAKTETGAIKRGRKPRVGPKTYGCTVCSTTFEKRRELLKHREIIHGIFRPLHTCTTCGKQYKEKQSLVAHTRVHTGERPYMCSYCGNSFSDAKTWKDHERRHRGEKPFLCTTCGKRFTYRQSFTRHMKFHAGIRPFQCSFCGKSFVLRQNMKEHEKRHNK